ncbi:MAG: hypothetical protein ABI197_06005 [Granulicella sp.]
MSNSVSTRSAYTKPSLIEYGSLTQRTQILRHQEPGAEPDPEIFFSILLAIINIFKL